MPAMLGPTANEKRQLFQRHALFGKLPVEALDALLAHARVERYSGGQAIFARGSPGRSMLAILSGSVRISAGSPSGPDIVLTILHEGDVFGEIALIDGQDRTADARAIVDTSLLVVDHRDFVPFLERRADVCILFLKLLCQRLRQTDQHVSEAMFGRLEDRMAKTLVRLAAQVPPNGSGSGPGRSVALRLTQQDLAGMIGATRESVNKQLHVWQAVGLLRLGKQRIEIPDIDALKSLS
jgi:CRP/FNR family transcriptional regulator, cyclic AMP receptor protein